MKVKEKFKYLLIGMIITVVFSALSPAIAAMVQKQITVATGVNIFVDDVKLNPVDSTGKPVEAFIYNGTTYLPVRAVANAVGKPVVWDGKTSSVYLGKHESNESGVLLHELDYFDRKSYGFKTVTDFKDNLGNTHSYGIHSNQSLSNWQTYYINGMYSKLKGKVILNYDKRSLKDETRVKVYGENKLIYTSPVITSGVHPIDFDIDLTGVLELKIEFAPVDLYKGYVGNSDAIIIADAILYQ